MRLRSSLTRDGELGRLAVCKNSTPPSRTASAKVQWKPPGDRRPCYSSPPRERMPRLRVPPSLRTKPKYPADGDGPRLWNAKRRIKTSKGLPSFASLKHLEANSVRDWYAETRPTLPATLQEAVEKVQLKDGKLEWWKLDGEHLENFMDAHEQLREVSKDVRSFIASTSHVYKQRTILEILRDPSRFFSNSSNVPLAMRKQVHL